ncbi:zinc-binding dehydrogenase [Herbiconiux moechotypicola]|uniref:NAD(P)-dependent alcohol dehydrogenase n=1 Tax=Herbiconiux moechotypicola TaxID=637393 RepID=A0ABN3DXT1_9MICO|nr:zinc-binding dehydrogenase [Herbiconiux moechotypicola]MCS5730849.1 zinc-binding dehydrogenase [Herbiconiux moechotypicola]
MSAHAGTGADARGPRAGTHVPGGDAGADARGPARVVARAVVARGDGSVPELVEVLLDPLGPRDVLVEIGASAVCRTELMTIDRRRADPVAGAPDGRRRVLGHAAAGRVTAVGGEVTRVRAGDAVVVTGTRQCGECFFCRRGAPGACDRIFALMERRVGETADGEEIGSDGGIGAHVDRLVYDESNLVRVRGSLPDEELALLGCGGPSGAGAVFDVAGVGPGQSVGISGCGHLGLWMVQAAVLAGAETVVAIDPDPWRRSRALALGAHHALDAGDDVVDRVHALTGGRGVDVGMEAAGSTLAMRQSFDYTRYGGRVVPTGLESERAVVSLDNLQYSLGSRTIVGAQCGGGDVRSSVPRLERLVARGRLSARALITGRYGLADAARAYAALDDPHQLTGVLSPTAPAHPHPTQHEGVPR